ncbi:hypothetical protein QBC38DRAFT_481615 [Podospora fimiseda]|uniref:Uncharacterized protein n=1 Tax=Podospora fimiseda TaxID=252190 RepID=A0AAN7BME7_9PEZI|nr:hypothetical protein QBC38DRAFT_481615 [Podospora fimiseda]
MSNHNRVSSLPPHPQAKNYYTNTSPSTPRIWDEQLPYWEESPSTSRPRSCIDPPTRQDRWSYDLLRMPQSPNRPRPQSWHQPYAPPRPATPSGIPVGVEEASQILGLPSRPPSSSSYTPPDSRPPSRPPSMFDNYFLPTTQSTTPTAIYGEEINTNPTLFITPPPPPSSAAQKLDLIDSTSYPITFKFTRGEKEKNKESNPSPQSTKSGKKWRKRAFKANKPKVIKDIDEPPDACCFGFCRRKKVKMIGGKVAAWIMGAAIPITFGAVMGVVKGFTGGR